MDFQKLLKPEHLKLAKEILSKWNVCDNCLGRQFAQLGSGYTNRERGKIIRRVLGRREFPEKQQGICDICLGFFQELNKWVRMVRNELRGLEFRTFLIGTVLSSELIRREESLWEETGIEWCESIKAEINREIGKRLETKTRKANKEDPDVRIILDLERNQITLEIKPVYVYGEYQKLVRGIPQTKWDKYPITIEDVIAKPFMEALKGEAHALHGCGREDIDARCLDWRPFVLEIKNPRKRKVDLKKMESIINKSKEVRVRGLRFCDRSEVIKVKTSMPDKTYRVLVEFEKPVEGIERVKVLEETVINQQTPYRVLHRRADKLRRKRVKNIKWKPITNKKFEFQITGEAGLYIKELVTGDKGRTRPSISEILGNPARVLELDVIKIHREKT